MNIETDAHYEIGLVGAIHGHGPVLAVSKSGAEPLYLCTNCGFVISDRRRFGFEDCDREDNPANETVEEHFPL